jgi:hypothetical protein
MKLDEIVYLDRYPIDQPTHPKYTELIHTCQADLAKEGAAVLTGFLHPATVKRLAQQVESREQLAFGKIKHHNVYLEPDDPNYSEDHPRNAKETTTSATLGYHHLNDVDDLVSLYHSTDFRSFVAAALHYPALFPYEDEVSPVNVLFYPPGTSLGWHFDNARFTTTLMIREAASGAHFEYVPFLRTDEDRAFDEISALRAGDRSLVKSFRQTDGTLILFTGSRTVHRVTKVEGDVTRMLATFTYSAEPGQHMSAHSQQTFYGHIASSVIVKAQMTEPSTASAAQIHIA